MQGGLAKLEGAVAQGAQGYEKIRGKIDAAEDKLLSGAGNVMSKVNEVNRGLVNQGVNIPRYFTGKKFD